MASRESQSLVGRRMAHYRIEEQLPGGAMGVVYRARDTQLERDVALKFPSHELCCDPVSREQLLREARAASALDHPNICTIHAVEETDDGRIFIVMAYYAGVTMKQRLAQGPLPVREVVELGIDVLDGLSRAHAQGIIHRDIKPANLIVPEGSPVKILDFGLAKRPGPAPAKRTREGDVARDISEDATRTGAFLGTPAYMSPEQIRKEDLDHRTDIWSVAVSLYELLTGSRPFEGDSTQALVSAILFEAPRPLSALRSEAPEELGRVLDKALAKRPRDRFQEAREMLHALQFIKHRLNPFSAPALAISRGPSIAVLPFANMSADPEQEFFCDGMAEEIINALARLEGLRVVARTSSFAFKGRNVDLREVGRRLNVGTVLEGSVRRMGDSLRITAQLIDVSDGYHLWSERFDRDVRDVFAVQDEISHAIAEALKIRLAGDGEPRLVRRHTENLEAYSLYLKGRFYWNKRTGESLQQSIRHFEQAIASDPDYALAYAGLADAHNILGYYGTLAPQRSFPLALASASKAVTLDDTLAEAHTSLAFAKLLYDWDFEAAEAGFERALSLNPGYATGRHWYAEHLAFTGRAEEAIAESHTALHYDPLSLIINVLLGWSYYYARRYDEAIEALNQTLALDRDFVPAHLWLGLAYLRRSAHAEAAITLEQAVELSGRSALTLAMLAQVRAASGESGPVRELLEELRGLARRVYVPGYHVAAVHHALGERDEALGCLRQAVERRDTWCLFLNIDPVWDDLREEESFQALVRRVGLPGG